MEGKDFSHLNNFDIAPMILLLTLYLGVCHHNFQLIKATIQ